MSDTQGDTERTQGRARAGAALIGGLCVACSGLFVFLLGLSTVTYESLLKYGARWVFKFNEPWWGWFHIGLGVAMVIVGIAAMFAARPAILAGWLWRWDRPP